MYNVTKMVRHTLKIFIFSKIFFIIGSVNMLWAYELLKSGLPLLPLMGGGGILSCICWTFPSISKITPGVSDHFVILYFKWLTSCKINVL